MQEQSASVATSSSTIKLIATDLDGTLLRQDKVISARTQQALQRIQAAGVVVVPVTGRPVRTLRPTARELGLTGLAICSNGAVIYDLDQERILEHMTIAAEVASELVVQLRQTVLGVYFAVERGLQHMGVEPGYLSLRQRALLEEVIEDDALALCRQPITKLIVRHPELGAEALLQIVQELAGEKVLATHSGFPFIEITAAGVHKASALAALCARLGIRPEEVIAFGDMPNDLEMLAWAGRSFAVANAHPDVLAQADEITLSNLEDGVAVVLERLMDNNLLL